MPGSSQNRLEATRKALRVHLAVTWLTVYRQNQVSEVIQNMGFSVQNSLILSACGLRGYKARADSNSLQRVMQIDVLNIWLVET